MTCVYLIIYTTYIYIYILFTLLDLCVSSLRRGYANILCIVPICTDDPRRESYIYIYIYDICVYLIVYTIYIYIYIYICVYIYILSSIVSICSNVVIMLF